MRTAIYLLLVWFVLGSCYLVYVQNIDGHLINKPIVFSVDTQNLQVEQSVYRVGDDVRVLFSFCRNRNYTTDSTWKLINETVVTYPTTHTVLKPECVKDRWVIIGTVPPYAVRGVHHLEGVTQIQLNPLNIIYVNYRSVNFQVR